MHSLHPTKHLLSAAPTGPIAQVWDLGGQTSIRPYWRCYYPNTQAIIYVVDSSDTERIGTSAEEFHAILDEEELKDALILVYANKQARRPSTWRAQARTACARSV